MGRRTQVDYPSVPQSHQLQEHSNGNYQVRYSWMDDPNGTVRRQYTQSIQTPAQTQAYLQPQWQPQPVPYSISEQTPIPSAAPSYSEVPREYSNKLQEAGTEWQTQNANYLPGPPALSPPAEAHSDFPKDRVKTPVKAINTEKASQWANLGPDENPLSPRASAKSSIPARSTTNIGVIPPQSMNFPAAGYQQVSQPVRGGQWHHNLSSCAEPSICMTGIFCPCVLYSRVQHRLSLRAEKLDASNLLGYNTVNGTCVAWTMLCGINNILSGLQRSRIRRSYEMDAGAGNCAGDCLLGCCCTCCVLAQNEKELKYREEEGRKAGMNQSVGYLPAGGMTYAPQQR